VGVRGKISTSPRGHLPRRSLVVGCPRGEARPGPRENPEFSAFNSSFVVAHISEILSESSSSSTRTPARDPEHVDPSFMHPSRTEVRDTLQTSTRPLRQRCEVCEISWCTMCDENRRISRRTGMTRFRQFSRVRFECVPPHTQTPHLHLDTVYTSLTLVLPLCSYLMSHVDMAVRIDAQFCW
jgi:hypothetical protein